MTYWPIFSDIVNPLTDLYENALVAAARAQARTDIIRASGGNKRLRDVELAKLDQDLGRLRQQQEAEKKAQREADKERTLSALGSLSTLVLVVALAGTAYFGWQFVKVLRAPKQ